MAKEEQAILGLAKECGYETISEAVRLVDGAQDYLGENNFYPVFEQDFIDELAKNEALNDFWEMNSLFSGDDELVETSELFHLFGGNTTLVCKEFHKITFFDGSTYEYEIKESKNFG